ncbi:MAG TPA: hypothetical protein VFW95_03015 [Candidatus Limnocylindria bacterium]|nr:hypothetical protein [Candidatus Limnocylindria bacterium]
MSRSARRRRGRPYQPIPERRNPWLARVIIIAVAILLILGSLALFTSTR